MANEATKLYLSDTRMVFVCVEDENGRREKEAKAQDQDA